MSLLVGEPTWKSNKSQKRLENRNIGTIFPLTQVERKTELVMDNAFNYVIDRYTMPKPVYIKGEQLVYRTSVMELNELYPIRWKDEDYALRKTEQNVEIFKFYPDKNDE